MSTVNPLHARFLLLLPRIEAHAKIYFRDIRCAAQRADNVAETIALAWRWFVRIDERGKDAAEFVTTLATLAARAVRCGRRVAGMPNAKDVMNRRAQQRHDYVVERLPDQSSLNGDPLTEALAENMVTPPPDAAAFRVDFPRWLGSLGIRARRPGAAAAPDRRRRRPAPRPGGRRGPGRRRPALEPARRGDSDAAGADAGPAAGPIAGRERLRLPGRRGCRKAMGCSAQ